MFTYDVVWFTPSAGIRCTIEGRYGKRDDIEAEALGRIADLNIPAETLAALACTISVSNGSGERAGSWHRPAGDTEWSWAQAA